MANIAIIGGGIAGLSAAYDLLEAGHNVAIYEASDGVGGLARGFKDDAWEWPLEHFYHHIFESDEAIIDLVDELELQDFLFFPTPITSMYHEGKIYPFSNPVDWWKFPPFDPISYVRFGLVGAYLRFTKPWRKLEKETAVTWIRRWYGDKLYRLMWKPLLLGKFGPHYEKVNMAWLWARLHVRSFKLGYFEGGFQELIDQLEDAVLAQGGDTMYDSPVETLTQIEGGWEVVAKGRKTAVYDQILHTTSPTILAKIAPELPADYLASFQHLDSMSAVVLTLALKQSLLTDGTYWLNLPAVSADKEQNAAPFLALVEHTNYIDKQHYGGDTIVYCGDYMTADHAYMSMSKEEILATFLPALKQFNPDFDPSWVRDSWLHRAVYAQPVPPVGHSANVPNLQTPLPGLYWASMSHVYPWDRGTNFAVQIGRQAAALMMKKASPND